MRRLSTFGSIFILLFPLAMISQEENRKAVEISVNPFSIISYKPHYRIGMNYIYKRWYMGIDAGYGNYEMNKFRVKGLIWGEDYQHWTVRPHILYTYKIKKEGIKGSASAGIEILVKHTKDQFFNNYYEDINTNVRTDFDRAWFRDILRGVHFVNQTRFIITENLSLEFLIGFGFAHRNIIYTSVQNPQTPDYYIPESCWCVNTIKNKAGERWIGRFTLSIDVTYRIF